MTSMARPHIRMFARSLNPDWYGGFGARDFDIKVSAERLAQRWTVDSWENLRIVIKIMQDNPGIGGGAWLG